MLVISQVLVTGQYLMQVVALRILTYETHIIRADSLKGELKETKRLVRER